MATRRVGVVLTSLGMQTVGLAAYAVTLGALGRWPTLAWGQVPYALALSLIGIVSLAALYRAFAIGPIAVVSPVVASTLGRPSEGVRIGFFATLGFAVWSAIFAIGVRETDGLALIVVQRSFSVALLAAFALARGISLRPLAARPALALVATTGVLDTGANVLLALGIAAGYASFVMTGSGAYPLIPALLAILVLRERLAPNQYVGVAVLVAGLVALGLQS